MWLAFFCDGESSVVLFGSEEAGGEGRDRLLGDGYDKASSWRLLEVLPPGDPERCKDSDERVGEERVDVLGTP